MGVNSLPKTVTRQRRDCDLNTGPSAPESSTLTTRLPSHPSQHLDCVFVCLLSLANKSALLSQSDAGAENEMSSIGAHWSIACAIVMTCRRVSQLLQSDSTLITE